MYALRLATAFFLYVGVVSASISAAELTIVVRDAKGEPLSDAVVTLTPVDGEVGFSALPNPEVQQTGALFSPFVLPVRTGTTVKFPNLDEFRHHVYSFSDAKQFELRLYGQDETKAVTFEKAGIVALGCNIHDNMLAYIYVSDAPVIGKAVADGSISFGDLPAGTYNLALWHPDQRRSQPSLPETISVAEGMGPLEFQLALKSIRRPQLPPSEEDYN